MNIYQRFSGSMPSTPVDGDTSRPDPVSGAPLRPKAVEDRSDMLKQFAASFGPTPNSKSVQESTAGDAGNQNQTTTLGPSPSLPKAGGAIGSMNEKFTVNPSSGTTTCSIPIPAPGVGVRGGVQPTLSLSYDSGQGNGIFGIGWSLGLGSITRKSEKGIPTYRDDKDIFIL